MSFVLMLDGTLTVLVGRLSMSDTVADKAEPVCLLFNDASGSICCCVSSCSFFIGVFYLKCDTRAVQPEDCVVILLTKLKKKCCIEVPCYVIFQATNHRPAWSCML